MSKICENCKQVRATVLLTTIDPDSQKAQEMHLCETCALETGAASKQTKAPISVAASLTSLLHVDKTELKKGAKKSNCPGCGMSYQEFRVKGRFGCAQCYDAFGDGLIALLEKVHGASHHTGPAPRRAAVPFERTQASLEQELTELRRKLTRVIKNEDYEEAAKLRDRIQGLEHKLTGQENV